MNLVIGIAYKSQYFSTEISFHFGALNQTTKLPFIVFLWLIWLKNQDLVYRRPKIPFSSHIKVILDYFSSFILLIIATSQWVLSASNLKDFLGKQLKSQVLILKLQKLLFRVFFTFFLSKSIPVVKNEGKFLF